MRVWMHACSVHVCCACVCVHVSVHTCLRGWVRACVLCVHVSVRTHVLYSSLVCTYIRVHCSPVVYRQVLLPGVVPVRLVREGGSQLCHDMPFIPFLCHSLLCQQGLHFSHRKHSLCHSYWPTYSIKWTYVAHHTQTTYVACHCPVKIPL